MPSWAFGLFSNLKPKLNPIYRKDVWNENAPFTHQTIRERVMKAVVVAKKFNLPLNLGEFGLWQNSNTESGYRWLLDVLSVCKELDITWTLWSYGKGEDGYGIIDAAGQELPKVAILKEAMK